MNKKLFLIVLLALVFLLAACEENKTGGLQQEEKQTASQATLYANVQPVPYFEWSLERHIMIQIYRARNEAAATYSYVLNPYDNSIMFECASIGYPIPGGTQLTNPEQLVYEDAPGEGSVGSALPMMEPNGLYSPATAAGTYVSCVNDDGTISPVFVEWYVWTFPYPMRSVHGKLVRVPGVETSIKIETTK